MVFPPFRGFLPVLLLAAGLCGCAEKEPFANHERQTWNTSVLIAGDEWRSAQRSYRMALHVANRNRADPGTIAVLALQYGRASGVICAWKEAEGALLEAYVLYKRHEGPCWKVLLELTRMSIARKEYRVASAYMREMLPLLEKSEYPALDPIGYAHILEDCALIAEKLMWDEEAVLRYMDRSADIHAANPGKPPLHAATPYGTECTPEKPGPRLHPSGNKGCGADCP